MVVRSRVVRSPSTTLFAPRVAVRTLTVFPRPLTQAQSAKHDPSFPTPTPKSPVRLGSLESPTQSAMSPSRPVPGARSDGPMSPAQAAAAAAAAVAAAAANAAAEVLRHSIDVTRQSVEFDQTSSEFVPPGTPLRDALLDAPEVPDYELDADTDAQFKGFGEHPVQPDSLGAEASDLLQKSPVPPALSETHFLRKDGGNQPAVMNSIAGLFGVQGGTSSSDSLAAATLAEEASRDAAFEEALERVRKSRRDIADKAAKGFSDMRAYYEAELRNARVGGENLAQTHSQPVPLSILARPRGLVWDLDETALVRALPTEGERAREREEHDKLRQSMESVWPEPWKGSYSPPNEPTGAPYPLAGEFTETADRAPENPPDVVYPKEAAEEVARRSLAVASAAAKESEKAVCGALASDRPSSPPIHKTIDTGNGRPDSEVVALANKVQALQRELVQSERREKHAERVADDAERRNEVLTTELKEANSKTQARDLESRELGRAVSVLKTEKDQAQADSVDTARQLTSVTSTCARLTAEAREFNNRRSALEREKGELVVVVNELKKENVFLKRKLSRAEGDGERLSTRVAAFEEAQKTAARENEHTQRDAEAARREVRAAKAIHELGAREVSGLSTSLQAAKDEIVEMRRRCDYLEKTQSMAGGGKRESQVATGGTMNPGRHAPAQRPFSAAYRTAAPPTPDEKAHRLDQQPPAPRPFSAAYRRADENRAPELNIFGGFQQQNKEDSSKHVPVRFGVEHVNPAGVATMSSQGDHLGSGMVPSPGSESREAFAGEYGDAHVGADTKDHFGSGMNVFSSFEGAAAAREAASAQHARVAAARADADTRLRMESAAHAAEASARAFAASEDARAKATQAASARETMDRARFTRQESARESARGLMIHGVTTAPVTDPVLEPSPSRETQKPTRYSAAEASRKGREGNGWFETLGDTTPVVSVVAQRDVTQRDSGLAPWLPNTDTSKPGPERFAEKKRVTGRASVPARGGHVTHSEAPFATSDSSSAWSSLVGAAEQRLMTLSQEKDQLEGALSRMPEGSGKTIEQRMRKANAEKRLEEVLKAASAARHQLKSANRKLGTA